MTLTTLLIRITIAAFILTLVVGFGFRKQKSWAMSFLQNFAGALFIFSGWVKAVDPLGTAYKLDQYFAEFETHFSWFAGLFPVFAEYGLAFSVIVIVLEIVLGIMLIIGTSPRWASWLFMGIVGFFTLLTGFTYLTGYVPGDATFFEFGKWGPYVDTNMKVTDCGCFGDFLVLKPKTSFLKDVFLLIPAIIFLFRHKDMHQLFDIKIRTIITAVSAVLLTLYCFSNFYWDIPSNDFRPFKKGVNIAVQKEAEAAAAADAPITYKLTNKSSGAIESMPMDDYLKAYKDYPKSAWDIDQERGEPAIKSTKISEFEVSDPAGNDITEALLSEEGYSFMVIAYKLKYDTEPQKVVYKDTTFVADTILNIDGTIGEVVKKVANVQTKELVKDKYIWHKDYQQRYLDKINPLAVAAEKDGIKTFVITSYNEPAVLDAFRKDTGIKYPFYTADDILLKTIVRSNPGVVLLKNGEIIDKWHYKQLPDYSAIKAMLK